MSDTAQYFDSIKDEYADAIRRSNPCYAEMLDALLGYLPNPYNPKTILELGCGTGNITLLINQKFPNVNLIGIDVSEGSLEICKSRLGGKKIDLRKMDMRTAEFANRSIDLVISGLALHHLTDAERLKLYAYINGWLQVGGWFVFCDRFQDESDQILSINRKIWKEGAFSRGSSEEEWAKWMKHESEHDHPGTLIQQVNWIKKEAGFSICEIVWRKYLWAVVYAQK